MMKPLLEGIRAICFGVGYVAPEAARFMAEFGAEVIKIESRKNMDISRSIALRNQPDINSSYGFNDLDRGLKSVTLDATDEHQRELIVDLVSQSDVFIENLAFGVAQKLGLAHEDLCKVKPDLIYASSNGFGHDGPYASYRTFGPNLPFVTGLAAYWRLPTDPHPLGPPAPHPDHIAGKYLFIAILAALMRRRRTGEGAFIECAQAEVAAAMLGEAYALPPLLGHEPEPPGNGHEFWAPHRVYPCAGEDSWIAMAIESDDEWERLTGAMGSPGWAEDERFAGAAERKLHASYIDEHIAEWTSTREAHSVVRILEAKSIRVSKVLTNAEYIEAVSKRGGIVEIDHPVAGVSKHTANPIHMSLTPPNDHLRAPCFGEHTVEIATRLLGLTEEEAIDLMDAERPHTDNR